VAAEIAAADYAHRDRALRDPGGLQSARCENANKGAGQAGGSCYRLAFAAAQAPTHFACTVGETVVDTRLGVGTTGELCFTGPPTAFGLTGPPTAFWAKARLGKALPPTPSNITSMMATLFILRFLSCGA
jgi:hypothetical protein